MYLHQNFCTWIELKSHFHEWSNLVIRLDVWHFMRRFAAGCCSESHALYATFMSRLSACVFEWDTKDLQIYAAKRGQLSASGVWRKRKQDVAMHITKKELALHSHCKRRTRGVEETTRLIKELIDTFSSDKAKDTMGIPLLKKTSIQQNWEEQKQHISSIQDVDDPAIQLYTQTGTLKKGSVALPMYRYA